MWTKASKARRRGEGLGGALIFKTSRGQAVVQGWPKPMTRAQYQRKKPDMTAFAICQWNFHYLTEREASEWISTSRATPYLPRDLYTQNAFGRLWAIQFPDQPTVYPMTARIDASEGLDLIANKPGQMIFRGDEIWEPLPWGNAGEVLKSQGPNAAPEWLPESGGGGGTGLPWTPPVLADFTQDTVPANASINEPMIGGIATILPQDDTGPHIILTKPRLAGINKLTVGINTNFQAGEGGAFGVGLMDDATGRLLVSWFLNSSGSAKYRFQVARWNNFRTENFGAGLGAEPILAQGPLFVEFEIDGNTTRHRIGTDPDNLQQMVTAQTGQAGDGDVWVIVQRNTQFVDRIHQGQIFHWIEGA